MKTSTKLITGAAVVAGTFAVTNTTNVSAAVTTKPADAKTVATVAKPTLDQQIANNPHVKDAQKHVQEAQNVVTDSEKAQAGKVQHQTDVAGSVAKKQNDLKGHHAELTAAGKDKDAATSQHAQAKKDADKAQGNLTSATNDANTAQGQKDQAKKDLQTAQDAINDKGDFIAADKDQLGQLQSQLDNANTMLNNAQTNLATAKKHADQAPKDVTDALHKLSSLQTAAANAHAAVDASDVDANTAQANYDTQAKKVSSLKDAADQAADAIKNAQKDHDTKAGNQAALDAEKAKTAQDLTTAQGKVDQAQGEFNNIDGKYQPIQGQISDLTAQLTALQKTTSKPSQLPSQPDKPVKASQTIAAPNLEAGQELPPAGDDNAAQIAKLKGKIETLQKQLDQLSPSRDAALGKRIDLKQKLEDAKTAAANAASAADDNAKAVKALADQLKGNGSESSLQAKADQAQADYENALHFLQPLANTLDSINGKVMAANKADAAVEAALLDLGQKQADAHQAAVDLDAAQTAVDNLTTSKAEKQAAYDLLAKKDGGYQLDMANALLALGQANTAFESAQAKVTAAKQALQTANDTKLSMAQKIADADTRAKNAQDAIDQTNDELDALNGKLAEAKRDVAAFNFAFGLQKRDLADAKTALATAKKNAEITLGALTPGKPGTTTSTPKPGTPTTDTKPGSTTTSKPGQTTDTKPGSTATSKPTDQTNGQSSTTDHAANGDHATTTVTPGQTTTDEKQPGQPATGNQHTTNAKVPQPVLTDMGDGTPVAPVVTDPSAKETAPQHLDNHAATVKDTAKDVKGVQNVKGTDATNAAPKHMATELPQTSEASNGLVALAGMAMIAMAGAFGLTSRKKSETK